MYFRNTKVYFQSTKVYSGSTKVYSPSTKVYFQSTSILSNYTSILSKNKSLLCMYKSILWRKNPKTRLLRVLFDSIDLLALFGVYAGIIYVGAMKCWGSLDETAVRSNMPIVLMGGIFEIWTVCKRFCLELISTSLHQLWDCQFRPVSVDQG